MTIKSAMNLMQLTLMLVPAFLLSRITRSQPALLGGVLLFALAFGGCTSRSAADPPRSPEAGDGQRALTSASIETVHRRKCGNCHTRVEPGSLPRATIEAAMTRHRRRAKLTDGQWAELIEFLSRSGPAETRHTASLP
ncbi:MAG TPA: hypothetical protein VK550_27975 [Polyangiaceae bacterium]|nr:hypothetical protein [Polyangiaceae bacterium]